MPGIVGMAGDANERLLDRMCNAIKHESWYKIDKFLKDEFKLARVHLGIVNSEPQPIYNEDKSLCIFMDGEIFDYEKEKEELKQKGYTFNVNNDPEFCLHLYEEYGEKFVKKLNGSFVLVILDEENRKLLIANDRCGLRPLYYTKISNKLLFGPELKAILEDKEVKKEINDDAVAEFFTFGQLLGNKTFFKGIEVLPPASILKWNNRSMSVEQYWDFRFEEGYSNNRDWVNELTKLFKQAVERRMKGKHNFGVLLSGGLDSRAVVAAIDKKYPITTFTFSFAGIDDSPKIAREVAETCRSNHKELYIERDFLIKYAKKGVYLTGGMIPIIHFSEISLLDKVRDYCDVIISAWGPEIVKGQYLDKQILSAKNKDKLLRLIYQKWKIVNETSSLFSTSYYSKISGTAFRNLKKELEKSKNKHLANKSDWFVFINREIRLVNLGDTFRRCKFVERAPFSDKDLLDFILKIPPELRYNKRVYLKFLKKMSPELVKIKNNHTGIKADAPSILNKYLPLMRAGFRKIVRIVRIKSRGLIKIPLKSDYPDYGEWLREDERLRKWVEDILLDESTLNRKYLNRDFIIKMVRDHMNYRKDYTQLIFLLLTFELWYRIFIEGEEVEKT